MVLKNNNK